MSTRIFTHTVSTSGTASGMTISGKINLPEAIPRDRPLLVALHGGTYSADYFDIPGYSLLDRAASLGIPVIAINRPGYGSSTPLAPERSTIPQNATVLEHVIGELWEAHGAGTSGVVLLGHSIGGAITTAIAANGPSWPLLGIAISGCLLTVPAESRATWEGLPPIPFIDLPVHLKDGVMFGAAWTHDEAMPQASYPSNSPVPRAELIDVTSAWIDAVRSVAAKVAVPVHHRQGEFDSLWITNAAEMDAFQKAFTSAPRVDSQLVPHTGHCIDFHRLGAAFQLEQLSFALKCSVRAPPG